MTAELKQGDLTKIEMASGQAIASIFAGLASRHSEKELIGSRNIYAGEPSKIVDTELRSGSGRPTKPKQLGEYLAAAGPLHCADGWSYLGKATKALLAGDPRGALHLAYYAELRAAISLLSSQGIGALNHRHFIVTQDGSIERISSNLGTHKFVWKVLEAWATSGNAATILGEALAPNGVEISRWLSGDTASWSTWQPVAINWFRQIGLDLKFLAQDQEARNLASYGVGDFTAEIEPDMHERLNFVVALWELLEPDQNARFRYLDQHVLRFTLEDAHKSSYPKASPITLESFVADALTNALGEGWPRPLEDFLLRRQATQDHLVFLHAKTPNSPPPGSSHLGAMARAALLLRVASGTWLNQLRTAGVDAESLAFYWAPYARARGLLDTDASLTSCQDLWDDIGGSLDEVINWMDDTPQEKQSVFRACRELASPLTILSSMEPVSLWSLA